MEHSFLASGKLELTNPPVYSGIFKGVSDFFSFPEDQYISNQENLNDLRKTIFPHMSEKLIQGTALLTNALNQALQLMLEEDSRYLHRRYRADTEKIIEQLKLVVLPTLDLKGFAQNCHLDNRMVVAAGSINLKDNVSSTAFYASLGGEKIFQSPSCRDSGTIWLNTEQTWHGVPEVTSNRQTLLLQWVWI